MPATYDLTAYRGDSFTRRFTFVDALDAPIDMSAGTWAAQVRTHTAAASSVDFVVDVSSAATGIVAISLDPTTTATVVEGVWDLQHTVSADSVDTVLEGAFCVSGDVTR